VVGLACKNVSLAVNASGRVSRCICACGWVGSPTGLCVHFHNEPAVDNTI